MARAAPLLASMHFGPEDAALRSSLQAVTEAAAAFPTRLNTAALFNPEDVTKVELLAQVKVRSACSFPPGYLYHLPGTFILYRYHTLLYVPKTQQLLNWFQRYSEFKAPITLLCPNTT